MNIRSSALTVYILASPIVTVMSAADLKILSKGIEETKGGGDRVGVKVKNLEKFLVYLCYNHVQINKYNTETNM